ncbi:hypothetical protein CPB86DRAFT_875489 [Serendipita vermifera]|nr:hypothetical protein CPB86DRAFT_875489 [Serendipita vermifera]
MSSSNPEASKPGPEAPQAVFTFPYTLESSDADCVVKAPLVLDLQKSFTILGWFQFVPPSGETCSGNILLIESPSVTSSLFSIWVEFPERAVHFSCTQQGDNVIKDINTGIKVPKCAFHLAIEYNLTAFSLYLNGEKCKTITEANPLPNPKNKFIVFGRSECKHFRASRCIGRLFGMEIYSESLTEEVIKRNYTLAVTIQLPIFVSRPLPVGDSRQTKEITILDNERGFEPYTRSLIFTAPKLVTRNFAYDSGVWSADKHLRLAADITKTGKAYLIGFGYSGVSVSTNNDGYEFGIADTVVSGLSTKLGWNINKHPHFLADTNGDGYPDLVGFGDENVIICRNNHDGTFKPSTQAVNAMFCNLYGWHENKHPRFVADLTGNGLVDIVGFGELGVFVAFNNGDGAFQQPELVLKSFGYAEAAGDWRVEKHPRFLADLTGDGKADVIGFGEAGVRVSINNGDKTFQSPKLVVKDFGHTAGYWSVNKHPRFLTDLTGDGRADIIGFGDEGIWVAINNGDGTFKAPQKVVDWFGYSDRAGGWRIERHPRYVMDITGDKCADIIGFYDDGVWVALNNGDGTFQGPCKVVSDFGYNAGGWKVDKHTRILADMTGNGRPDIVGFGEDGVYVSFNVGNGRFGPLNNLN